MADIKVKLVKQSDSGYEFAVTASGFSYKVSLSVDYYQKLTGGRVTPEELIEKSFEFLLEQEPAGSILSEFSLPQINQYFPNYEQQISANLQA